MKHLIIIIVLLLAYRFAQAQDLITKTNGKEIPCKITREDSLTYFITTQKLNNEIKTYINKSDVLSVKYGIEPNNTSQTPSDSIIMKPVFGGYQFYQGDRKLKLNQLVH